MDGQLQREFRRNGYFTVERALAPSELNGLRDACDALLSEAPVDGGSRFHDIGRGDARRFLRHRHRDFPAVEGVVFGAAARGLASMALCEPLYLFNEQFVVKSARTGASFAWHQDSAYVGFEHEPYVTLWIALDDTDVKNGCVYVLPRDLDRERQIEPHRWDPVGKEKVGYEGPDAGIAVEVSAGSVLVFSSLTLHRSGANTTDHARRAYICQYSSVPILDPATGAPKHFATRVQP